jgi:hypothetical protein
VTTRILVVDILSNRIRPQQIAGAFDTFGKAHVLQHTRQAPQVKALSRPERLTHAVCFLTALPCRAVPCRAVLCRVGLFTAQVCSL